MLKHSHTMFGQFGYAVARGEPGVDLRTNQPAGQVILHFEDQQSGEVVDVVMGDDAARDLANKVLDTLRVPGVMILPGGNGKPQR